MARAKKRTILKSGFCRISLLLALAACSAPVEKAPGAGPAKAPVKAPAVEIVDDFEGDGMEMPLDGSSVEAFDASLALVRKHSSEENYRNLEEAINYLMAFDISVRNKKTRLISRLDGLTGYEVIAKVESGKPAIRRSGVKKSAADTTGFDT